VQVGRVTAVAWPDQMPLAVALAQEADRQSEWPGLGARGLDSVRLVVVRDGRVLDSLTGGRAPEWGAAIAIPETRTIAIRADGTELSRILRHELAHLALHQAVRVPIPLWFDEGYASWAAGEWERLGVLDLNLAVARGAVPDLIGLDNALRGGQTTAEAAYALATSAVVELARRNPTGTLGPLLEGLGQGVSFDRAVLATTGLTLDQFDEAWHQGLRRRYGLVTWLLAGGGWLLVAAIVLGLVHFRRRADRDRRAALDVGWEVDPEAMGGTELDPTRPS
jgi:Peptidase MA superfamily